MCTVDPLSGISTCIGIVKEIWPWVRDCVCYRKILHEKMTSLIEERNKLKARKKEIREKIKNTLQHGVPLRGEKPTTREVVNTWLENVKAKRGEVKDIESRANKKRYFGRWKFLRDVDEKITDVKGLIVEGNFPEGLFIYVHQDPELKLGTVPLVGESTKKIMQTILDCVKNGTCIGIWGMGGSGKTTITTHVHDKLLKNRDTFGSIYWVTVSEDSDVPKLQDKIANALDFQDFSEEEDKIKRVALLSKKLEEKKKFVLILDDMWEAFPPEEVGIPIGVNAGKLILTSRSKDVCNVMKCQTIIQVKPLADKEAWDLFLKKLGREEAAFSPEEKKCAVSIVKECSGLPLAIVTVATSMRSVNNIRGWRVALEEFKECAKGVKNTKGKVINGLKFSYDRLGDDDELLQILLQQCFLYCALFREDYKIKRTYLIMCWIAEGLVDEMETRQKEFDKGHDLLDKLENACLLERTRYYEDENCVKMHDLIRDMALEITRAGGQFMVKAGVELKEFPSEGNWSKNLERVSLMGGEITRQPSRSISPECPKLSTLMLQSIKHFKEIPNSLFLHLKNLRVLDMSDLIEVESLPDSISDLEKLRALLLKNCVKLRYVPSLSKLTELRELDLWGTNIEKLPHGLEKLVNLRSLLLKFKITDDEQVKEISSLEWLEVLCVFFDNLSLFTSYVIKTQHGHHQRMSRYLLQIGSAYAMYSKVRCRQVHIRDCNLIGGVEDPLVLPTNMQEFWIQACGDLTSLSDISSSLDNAKELERCRIENCDGIKQLWSWPIPSLEEECTNTNTSSLHSLRTLMLHRLKKLKVIFNIKGAGVGGCGTFSNLKVLLVSGCNNLKYVFTRRLVQHHLQNLQVIHVAFCKKMENIIVSEEVENQEEIVVSKEEEVTCPTLQRLEMAVLPKLKSIWSGTMLCPSLKLIKVQRCKMLKRLPIPLHSQTSSTLLKIRGEQKWWNLLEWDLPNAKSVFEHEFAPLGFYGMMRIGRQQGKIRTWTADLKHYEEY